MTSEWSWTLTRQNYAVYTKYTQRLKMWSVSLYQQSSSRYKVVAIDKKSQKCIECPQSDFEPLTVKSTMYTLSTYPQGPNFGAFPSTASLFWCMQGFLKVAKIGNRITSGWSWTLKSQTFPAYKTNLLLRHILFCFSLRHPFSRYKVFDNRKCIKWPQNDLDHLIH